MKIEIYVRSCSSAGRPFGFARRVGRLPHPIDRRLQDRAIQAELVAEMIVHGRDVRPGIATDFRTVTSLNPRSANKRSAALGSRARVRLRSCPTCPRPALSGCQRAEDDHSGAHAAALVSRELFVSRRRRLITSV